MVAVYAARRRDGLGCNDVHSKVAPPPQNKDNGLGLRLFRIRIILCFVLLDLKLVTIQYLFAALQISHC
jgi:hypothetical protein